MRSIRSVLAALMLLVPAKPASDPLSPTADTALVAALSAPPLTPAVPMAALRDPRRDVALTLDDRGDAHLTRADGRRLDLRLRVDRGGVIVLPPPTIERGSHRWVARQGPITTTWSLGERLEQSWTVSGLSGAGPLRLTLTDTPAQIVDGVAFVGAFAARHLRAWDADGTPVPAAFDAEDGLAVLVDPTGADEPITIDPAWEGAAWWGEVAAEGGAPDFLLAGLGDQDGDGLGTVAIATTQSFGQWGIGSHLTLLHGRVGGSIASTIWIEALAGYVAGGLFPAGDLHADGAADLLLLDTQEQRLWQFDGSDPPAPLALDPSAMAHHVLGADTDGDGGDELLLESYRGELWWQPDGAPLGLLGPLRGLVDAGDLDGDGADELIALDQGTLTVVPGSPAGPDLAAAWQVQAPETAWVAAAVVGDLDGDGDDELIGATYGYVAQDGVWRSALHRLDGLALPPVTVVPSAAPTELMRAGDVTGDGIPDLLGRLSGAVSLWAGGATSFTRTPGEIPYAPLPTQPGDLDGDGIADLVLRYADGVLIFHGGPQPLAPSADPEWRSADVAPGLTRVGDLDGDGDEELATTVRRTAPEVTTLEIFAGGPGGPATTPTWTFVAEPDFEPWASGAVGDLDGDGIDDLLVRNGAAGVSALRVHLGSPAGPAPAVAWAAADPPGAARSFVYGFGDVTGDGRADLLVHHPAPYPDATLELWPGAAGGVAAAPVWSYELAYGQTTFTAAGDLNGDGRQDIILGPSVPHLAETTPGTPLLLYGGPLGFLPPVVHAADTPWSPLAPLGDADGDGMEDLIGSQYRGPPDEVGGLLGWHGGPAGLRRGAVVALSERSRGRFGDVSPAGDLNGDGRVDLAVAVPLWRGGEGIAIYFGHAGLVGPWPAWVAPEGTRYAIPIGDVNGDGYDDLILIPDNTLWFGGSTLPATAPCEASPDADGDGVCAAQDGDDADPITCRDGDRDGCDDCGSGRFDPAADGPDIDSDGLCDPSDPDRDGDRASDLLDAAPSDPSRCGDHDGDGCDDCDSGAMNTALDGPNHDGDGRCDVSDSDDDDDGVFDADDSAPEDGHRCGVDLDLDGCDDCSNGRAFTLGDGPDLDHNGVCSAADPWEHTCVEPGAILLSSRGDLTFGRALGVVGDLDGDGLPDIMTANTPRYPCEVCCIYDERCDARPAYGTAWRSAEGVGPGPETTTLPTWARGRGDADGDGLDDLLLATHLDSYDYPERYLGGTYELHGPLGAAPRWSSVLSAYQHATAERQLGVAWVGDVDSDGHDDFATFDPSERSLAHPYQDVRGVLRLWSGDGPALVAERKVGGLWERLHAALDAPWDITGDGRADLAIAGLEQLWVLPGTPGGFGAPILWADLRAWPSERLARHADVTGDGWTDLVFGPATAHTGAWVVLPGGPGGVGSTPLQLLQLPYGGYTSPVPWALADVDGDGAADLLVASSPTERRRGDGLIRWYPGGAGGFAEEPSHWRPDLPRAASLHALDLADVGGAVDLVGAGTLDGRNGHVVRWPLSALAASRVPPWRERHDGRLGAWLVVADHDGDGDDDLLVDEGDPAGVGDAAWHAGGPGGPEDTPARVGNGNASLLPAGDVDGDGAADLLERGTSSSTLWLGGPQGPGDRLPIPRAAQAIGDVNGDGYGDLADVFDVAWPLVYGGSAGVTHAATWSPVAPLVPGLSGPLEAGGLAAVSDLDRDGDDELLVAWRVGSRLNERVYAVYPGDPAGPSLVSTWHTTTTDDPGLYVEQASVGDLNGDGWPDLVLAQPGANPSSQDGVLPGGTYASGRVRAWSGGPAGLGPTPMWEGVGRIPGQAYGLSVSAAYDMNGDGFDDLLIGTQERHERATGALVLPGGPAGPGSTPMWQGGCSLAPARAQAGDLNGDGYGDLVVAEVRSPYQGGAVYVWLGGRGGLRPASERLGGVDTAVDTGVFAETDVLSETDVHTDLFAETDEETDVLVETSVLVETDVLAETGVSLPDTAAHTDVRADTAHTDPGRSAGETAAAGAPESLARDTRADAAPSEVNEPPPPVTPRGAACGSVSTGHAPWPVLGAIAALGWRRRGRRSDAPGEG